jgi:hypothetical protein
MGTVCGMHGGKRNTYGILVGKPEENITLVMPKHSWKNNIKLTLEN